MEFTRTLRDITKDDAEIAGGKGASLGEMIRAGIPVPDGCVVLSSAFTTFLHVNNVAQEIETILKTVDHTAVHTVEAASEKIRQMIESSEFPEEMSTDILKHYAELAAGFVAVRSSATSEDGVEHAWAGQLDSFLNTSEDALLENVKKCWSSLFTPRAIFYRFEKQLQLTEISVAVIIQKMIQSEISGIAFSVHPITQDPNQLIIEAGFGLGEAIVSGAITPNSYVVDKNTLEIVDITTSTQEKGLFISQDGINEWREISEPQASSQVLDEEHILEVAKLIIAIEKHYGFPCDIEWAYESSKFYIVQSRPITTLRKPYNDSPDFFESEKMIFMGKRQAFMHEAKLKILARSEVWERELGIGYKTAVTNSLGEYFVDENSAKELELLFRSKDFEYAAEYADKLSRLRDELLKEINHGTETDLTAGFSTLMAYFFIVKTIYEMIYDASSTTKKMTIEKWRNDATLFDSLELYYKRHPEQDQQSDFEWSWIWNKGVLELRKELISFTHEKELELDTEKMHSETNGIIKGNSAFPGIVRGKVRLILAKEDKDHMEEGEIIVAPMTTVDFLPIMKKAAAFVTDEGGITSHAAIIAREMKKPGVIGTRIATQVLKTGMEIEVDANTGIIKIPN